MRLLLNAESITIDAEEGVVALDLGDPTTGIACRAVCTPSGALKLAAALMEASEKADGLFWEEIA